MDKNKQGVDMAKTVIFLLLFALPALATEEPWVLTIAGNTTALDDTELRASAPTTNYGTANESWFGYSGSHQSTLIFRWNTLSDSLALGSGETYPAAEIDSILLILTASSPCASSESLAVVTYTCRRNTWVESGATWNAYDSLGTAWGTAGAKNTTSDRYSDATTSRKLRWANTQPGAVDTFYINPTNFGSSYESTILEYTDQWGASPLVGFYLSEITSVYAPYQPVLKVYGSPAAEEGGIVSYSHGPGGNAPAHGPDGNRQAHK